MDVVPSVVGGVPREEGGIERTERPALAVAAKASTRVRKRARWSVMISTVAPGVVVESVKGGYEMDTVTGRASTSHEPASNCQMTSLHRPATSAHISTRGTYRGTCPRYCETYYSSSVTYPPLPSSTSRGSASSSPSAPSRTRNWATA